MTAKQDEASLDAVFDAVGEAQKGPKQRNATTAISLPPDLLKLLRLVAMRRDSVRPLGSRAGGVSQVLSDLVEKHKKELESELK